MHGLKDMNGLFDVKPTGMILIFLLDLNGLETGLYLLKILGGCNCVICIYNANTLMEHYKTTTLTLMLSPGKAMTCISWIKKENVWDLVILE